VCAVFHLPAAIYLLLSSHGSESRAWITIAVVLEQLSYGVGTVGIQLVAMGSLATGPYRTAHLAFATGLCGLGAALAGMVSGHVQSAFGYPGFFGWALALSAAPLGAAWICTRRGYLPSGREPVNVRREAA
jgi:PAT family beta-lactamase induction signal transducer AmpG